MDADGSIQEQLTAGGPNANNEANHGAYLIGIDTDPDMSPDNKQVDFSRLRTGIENVPFSVFELVALDLESKGIEVLDTQVANMMPQWKFWGNFDQPTGRWARNQSHQRYGPQADSIPLQRRLISRTRGVSLQ
jgi:hypothetical protein